MRHASGFLPRAQIEHRTPYQRIKKSLYAILENSILSIEKELTAILRVGQFKKFQLLEQIAGRFLFINF